MSLTDGNGLSAADIAAVTGNSGNGFGFGNDGAWWILILFLFAFMGNNGWNGNSGNGGSGWQRGFDQQSVMGGINGITSAVANGFANAEVSRCNSQANILQTLNANQNANTSAMNSLAMGLQNCCCENRAGVADLKYTVATEACADRAAVSDGLRDVIASQTANTQAIINSQNSGFQALQDKLCQLELDNLRQRYQEALAENTALKNAQSQSLQTSQILADNAAQTANLIRSLNPTPIPAYVVQNPSCCNTGMSACGCGVA